MLTVVVVFASGSSACSQANNSATKSTFTSADFEKLRWLEGTWRGSGANGQDPFFERYHFDGDNKIAIDSLSDATSSKVDNQGSIYLENGEIIHKNGSMVWVASRSDGSLIEFVPKEKATNAFAWQKESADVWTFEWQGRMQKATRRKLFTEWSELNNNAMLGSVSRVPI